MAAVLTLILLAFLSLVIGYVALMCVASCLFHPPRGGTMKYGIVSLLLVVATLALSFTMPIKSLLSVFTMEGLVLSLLSYFLGQRYELKAMKSDLVYKHPTLILNFCLGFMSSSVVLLGVNYSWYFGIIPLFTWVLVALLATELAIFREVKRASSMGQQHDRQMAIFAVNLNQGRELPSLYVAQRKTTSSYPYP